MLRALLTLSVFVVLLSTPVVSRGEIIRVYPDGSGDASTIAEAFIVAAVLDTVLLGDGVFYEYDLDQPTRVSIHSESGNPNLTVIDAQGLGRCMAGTSVTGAPTVRGITFRNGVSDGRGGCVATGSDNARFHDCIFENGSAAEGGGVSINGPSRGTSPQFFNCRFESNRASGDGGGLWSSGNGYLVECEFVENSTSGNGGAVYGNKDRDWGAWLRSCVFERNWAEGDGGAVFSEGNYDYFYGFLITNGVFQSNYSTRGGAARLEGPDSASGSIFIGNEAVETGGALCLVEPTIDKEYQTFNYTLFARNKAGEQGGAIYLTAAEPHYETRMQLFRTTFVENEAPQGGHIWGDAPGTWARLRNSILAFAGDGAAAAGSGTIEVGCSDVFGNVGGDYIGPLLGLHDAGFNISEDPLFCLPAGDDYTLAEASPCAPSSLPPSCSSNGPMGRFGVGCDEVGAVEAEVATIGMKVRVSPSPAREEARISYLLATDIDARIDIYDIHGRRVRSLARASQSGNYDIVWDGRDNQGKAVATGTYFVRLHSTKENIGERFVFLR